MNRYALLALVLVVSPGCKSLQRMTGTDKTHEQPKQSLFIDPNALGSTPAFNVPVPDGYSNVVYHGRLDASNNVVLNRVEGARLHVFLKDKISQAWFELGVHQSGGYWATFDDVTSAVTYHGQWLNLNEYCIYQFVPVGSESAAAMNLY